MGVGPLKPLRRGALFVASVAAVVLVTLVAIAALELATAW